MTNKQPLVTIKGKKDGLTLELNDRCSYEQLIQELKGKLSERRNHYHDGPLISVKVEAGNRYLNKNERDEIQNIIRAEKKLFVADIESNILTKEESAEQFKQQQLTPITQIIRSGQILRVDGDLLLIGDVNPGGKVLASGNIYIMGALRGMAHAGCDGRDDKVIAASLMKPSQLMIATALSRSPDGSSDNEHLMECAFIDHDTNQIAIERLQTLFRRSNEPSKSMD